MTIPNEGETLALELILSRILTDRDANMELGLYTNSGLDLETATEAALTEPSDGGYARKVLTDGTWVISGDDGSHVALDFTAVTTPMTGIQGTFIATNAAVGTKRILSIIAYPSAPLSIPVGEALRINLAATGA